MRILSRYYLARFLVSFATVLVAATLVIVVVDLLANFDDVLAAQGGFQGMATSILLRVASEYLRDLIPVSAFAAAFFTLGSAARWLEITAAKSGGISPHRILLPIFGCSVLLTAAALLVNETVILEASRAWARQRSGATETVTFRRGSFWYHRGDTIYNFEEADEDSRRLRGVTVLELDDAGRLHRSIRAEQALIEEDGSWRLSNATIRGFDPDRPQAPVETASIDETVLQLGRQQDVALGTADASQLGLAELRESIETRTRSGDDVGRSVGLLHSRLAAPLAVLLFVVLGAPLGLRVEQTRSMAEPALVGVAAVALFFVLRNAAGTLAREGAIAPHVAPWLVIGAFGAYALWRLSRVAR